MSNEFEILSRFLDRYGPDVEGRLQEEPAPEVKQKLDAFARGVLPAKERNRLIDQLRDQPALVAELAEAAKRLRHE
jgi:hypothetical protein